MEFVGPTEPLDLMGSFRMVNFLNRPALKEAIRLEQLKPFEQHNFDLFVMSFRPGTHFRPKAPINVEAKSEMGALAAGFLFSSQLNKKKG